MKKYLKQQKGEEARDRKGAEHDCGRIFAAIHDAVDETLAPELQAKLDRLREKCPFCVDTFLQTLRLTVDLCRRQNGVSLSEEECREIHRQVLAGVAEMREDGEFPG